MRSGNQTVAIDLLYWNGNQTKCNTAKQEASR